MKKKLYHYYPDGQGDLSRTTACGRDGHNIGGLIASFFKIVILKERCKICNKQFEKDQKIFEIRLD